MMKLKSVLGFAMVILATMVAQATSAFIDLPNSDTGGSIVDKSCSMLGMRIGQLVTPSEYEGSVESSLTIFYDPHKTLLGRDFNYSASVSPITFRVHTLSAIAYFESQEEAREVVSKLNRVASKLFRTTPKIWSSRRKQNQIGMEISTHKLQDQLDLQIFYVHRPERPNRRHLAMVMLINYALRSESERECAKWRCKALTKFAGLVYGTSTEKYTETIGSPLELGEGMKAVRYLAGQTTLCSHRWMRVVDSLQPAGVVIGVELAFADVSLDYDSLKRMAHKITRELEAEYDNFAVWNPQDSSWTIQFPANFGYLIIKPDKRGTIKIEAFAFGNIKSKGVGK